MEERSGLAKRSTILWLFYDTNDHFARMTETLSIKVPKELKARLPLQPKVDTPNPPRWCARRLNW